MQNFARRHAIPIDQLCFDFQVQHSDTVNEHTAYGVYCYGLFIDGARWDMSKYVLIESNMQRDVERSIYIRIERLRCFRYYLNYITVSLILFKLHF